MKALDVYNELKDLDPDEIQNRASEIIQQAIDNCSEENKKLLMQQQWCLDNELRKYKDPVARMNKMVEIFWKGVVEFHDATTFNLPSKEKSDNKDCKIIEFKPK